MTSLEMQKMHLTARESRDKSGYLQVPPKMLSSKTREIYYKTGERPTVNVFDPAFSAHTLSASRKFQPSKTTSLSPPLSTTNMSTATSVQSAIYEYYSNYDASFGKVADAFGLARTTFYRMYKRWVGTQSAPTGPEDVRAPASVAGRRRGFDSVDEDRIAQTALGYAKDGWPLTVALVQDLATHYLVQFCPVWKRDGFTAGKPSRGWANAFVNRRPDLKKVAMRVIDDKRMLAISKARVAEHISRVQAICARYRIDEPSRVFNLDESGASFDKMTGRSLRRGVGPSSDKSKSITRAGLQTKGRLNHVTVMGVVSADGRAYKPAVVFPGNQHHYRVLASGKRQTVHDFLPPCYLFHRDPAGVDAAIFARWAEMFIVETADLRKEGKYLLVVCDGYSGHVQFKTLSMLRDNRILMVAMPSHSSHVLQPLDVGVFSSYKSHLQSAVHRISRHTNRLDVFGAANCIAEAYNASFTFHNIVHSFESTGLWVREVGGPSLEPLVHLFKAEDGMKVTVPMLMASFDKSTRGLIFGADVVDGGTVRIDTSAGVNLTSDTVIDALKLREDRRRQRVAGQGPSVFARRAAAKRKMSEAVDQNELEDSARKIRREELDSSRKTRIAIRKFRAARAREGAPFNGDLATK